MDFCIRLVRGSRCQDESRPVLGRVARAEPAAPAEPVAQAVPEERAGRVALAELAARVVLVALGVRVARVALVQERAVLALVGLVAVLVEAVRVERAVAQAHLRQQRPIHQPIR